jgi:hypothetical protein
MKPYAATFASRSADSVWRERDGEEQAVALRDWWRRLPHEATLCDLLQGDARVFIAAGAAYMTAVADDLDELIRRDECGAQVFVVSAGAPDVPLRLPVDGSFRSAFGGTDSSINARVLAWIARTAGEHHFSRAQIVDRLENMRRALPPPRTPARRLSDDAVKVWVEAQRRTNPAISRTAALRTLRGEGFAYEQGRFATLWDTTS